MKKILLAILLCVSLCACSEKQANGFIESDVQEILTKIANKDTFLIVINTEECYSCDTFKSEIEKVVEKNDLHVYTLNYQDISDVDNDQLNIALGKYSTWPAAFYVVESEIPQTNKYEYSLDPEGWKTWLENMKIIKA
ncbi:MAG: hypothetical protein EOM50_03075 [Erysipelotrichia bacterium]|nr:hypothetical protein [Erysipelotrichia bacterium]NCC54265.1 hypothetical protein [Erysipelotrichia bacterium]